MDMRDAWVNNRNNNNFIIPSPDEDLKFLRSQMCTQGQSQSNLLFLELLVSIVSDYWLHDFAEGVRAGVKSASIACVATAIPTVSTFIFCFSTFCFHA